LLVEKIGLKILDREPRPVFEFYSPPIGTQKGELMGIPPTGRKVTFQGMRFFKFRGTKCIETWNLTDMLAMMQQLGIIKT
jgi:predicted ester cyclase